jgi:hypothetical protein
MKPAAPRAGFGFFFVREGWRFDAKNSLSGRPSQDRARWSGIDKPELTLANLDTFLAPVTLLSMARSDDLAEIRRDVPAEEFRRVPGNARLVYLQKRPGRVGMNSWECRYNPGRGSDFPMAASVLRPILWS